MPTLLHNSFEYQAFEHLRHWQPLHRACLAQQLLNPSDPSYSFFLLIFQKTKALYARLPRRKNGEDPFVHPLNVVLTLRKAKITDAITLAAGLMHDYVEEIVDLYKEKHKILAGKAGIRILDKYEEMVFSKLQRELSVICEEQNLNPKYAGEVIAVLHLLTRHKRDFYYRSISNIFNCKNRLLKERALQVKLADRMHNVLSVECFDESERLYQCFKNFFILNNTKKFLLQYYGKEYLLGKKYTPTEKLFNKCARATYDAFLTICHLCSAKGIRSVTSMLQLAFKKFALEKQGLWVVTEPNPHEIHPLRLYQGIVRKFDAKLHHEWAKYKAMNLAEKGYCIKFFGDFHFSQEQLDAILCYKDAYALKEVVAYLMYQPEYTVSKFVCSDLSKEGRIKR